MSINVSAVVYTVSWGLSFVPLLKKGFWIEGEWSYMNKLKEHPVWINSVEK